MYDELVKLLLATTNKGKVIEMRNALDGLELELLTLENAPGIGAPKENGKTYMENALIKARYYFEQTGFATVADDSGIEIEALQNELGIHTRRWGKGPDVSDSEWIEFFLERMSREDNKRARFLCAIAYIDEAGQEHLFEGTCDGIITEKLEADYLPGLPLSACFRPNGSPFVFSALGTTDKAEVSHRGKALRLFRSFVEQKES